MYEILPGKSRDWYKIAASIDLQTITFNKNIYMWLPKIYNSCQIENHHFQ